MPTTSTEQSVRTAREPSRASAKSGSVYAPERRSGAATSTSSTRYPAVQPIGYQSISAPKVSSSPATPRKEAAERYSPPIALALSRGRTVREATKKSLVVREIRSPQVPMASVARETITTATTPGRTSVPTAQSSSGSTEPTSSAKSRSLDSERRTYHQPSSTSHGYASTPSSTHASGI